MKNIIKSLVHGTINGLLCTALWYLAKYNQFEIFIFVSAITFMANHIYGVYIGDKDK